MSDLFLTFPRDFIWGAATAAYQIEGAVNEDGRGPSIWDTFSHTPGKIFNDDTGDVADDHYHRWKDDIALIASLGLGAYRFSIAWSRVLPQGKGTVNGRGLDFYDRLVDGLLANKVQPWVTLYHWDLPQALQDEGGWSNRQTADYFADYARITVQRLGDRVKHWITLNEPYVSSFLGHHTGVHAPGIRNIETALEVAHHLHLAHGLAVEAIRSAAPKTTQVGITLNLHSIHPASQSEADLQAARRFDGIQNRLFLDPISKGSYPQDLIDFFGRRFPSIGPDDMHIIQAPVDFLGVNNYFRFVIQNDPDDPDLRLREIFLKEREYTEMWEIYPPGIYEVLTRVWKDYGPAKMYITENGCAVPDGIDADGRVRDYRRTRFLRDHLFQCYRAIGDGVPLKGYFVWSLMDNFEWAYGYAKRFGITYIDYSSQKRTLKDSGAWYSRLARANGFDLNETEPFFPR
ncbi:MAG: beta-glucosidase [Chloroflexi bacterium RBG_16_57_11]|nr:MAG: beta-glucosidase [Chloroflexi bacterium RBG_16_57_11]